MVPGQHRAGEVVETARTRLAPVALAMRLRVVAPVPAQTSGLARTTEELSHPGQHTPSDQRCWRTSAKHLASSISPERLTKSEQA